MAIKTLKPTIKTKRTANKMNDRQKYNNNNNNGRKGNLEIEYAKRGRNQFALQRDFNALSSKVL